MGRFHDKKNHVTNRENYGRQKMNLIIHFKQFCYSGYNGFVKGMDAGKIDNFRKNHPF